MFLRKLIPCALFGCLLFGWLSVSASAQSAETRQKFQEYEPYEIACTPDDFSLVAENLADERIPDLIVTRPASRGDRFRQLITAAIDQRLGTRYRWGGAGPNGFDCSGFVWSIFQSAGINFERVSASALWGRFEPPALEERYKFGTLVFFNNLAHVGVVADEEGFYHASRNHGVIYSPFSEYWVSRIDGFRKVPLPVMHHSTK